MRRCPTLFYSLEVCNETLIPPAAYFDLLPMEAGAADTLVCFSSEEGRLTSTRTSESYPVRLECLQFEFLPMKTFPRPAT